MKKLLLVLLLLVLPVIAQAQEVAETVVTAEAITSDVKVIGQDEMDTRPAAIDLGLINDAPVVGKLPSLKNGAYFSLVDNKVNYSATVPVLSKGGFSLNVGYAGRAKNTGDKIIASLAYDLGNLERLGVNVPILKYVGFEPYICFAGGDIGNTDIDSSESDFGVGVNLLSFSF